MCCCCSSGVLLRANLLQLPSDATDGLTRVASLAPMPQLCAFWQAMTSLQPRSKQNEADPPVPSLPCKLTRGDSRERWVAKQIEKGRGRRLQPLGNWSHAARRSALSRSTALDKLQPARRRTTRPHGTSSLASAAMRDSPACTLRAVWDAARRPDAPVRRPRPAPRRRSLQQLRGAFMATPSCSPRRRRRGNRDRGRPTRQRLPTTIGAGPGRRRAGALRVVRCLDGPANSSGRSEDKIL